MNTCILSEVLPSKFKDMFARSIFTPKQWVDKFTEANYIVGSQYDSEEEGVEQGEEEDYARLSGYRSPQVGQEEIPHDMSSDSVSNFGENKVDHFDLDAMGEVEEGTEVEHAAWAPRAAFELLRDATLDMFAKQGEQLRRMKRTMSVVVKEHLVELGALIQEHGSLEAALMAVYTSEQVEGGELERLQSEIEGFHMRLDEFAEAAEVDKADVLRTIKAVLAAAQRGSQRATQRISQIEHLVQLRIPSTTSHAQGLGTQLDGDTSFGTVQIGGNNHDLTMHFLYQQIVELKTSVTVLMERAKSTGIIFNGREFASESEFAIWFASKNTAGGGMAAFVDFISMWSFSTVDNQETLDMLTERTKAAQLGLGSNYDAQYLNSFMQRYPRQLFGKGASAVTSTTVIEALKDW
jgi:hypothetical protein